MRSFTAPGTVRISPQNVSARLREAGYLPVPHLGRVKGISVTRGGSGGVTVWVDFEGPRRRARGIEGVTEVLAEKGYTVEANPGDPAILYVSRKAAK